MEHKVEIWNRGDMAIEVITPVGEGEDSRILNPDERVTFDASEGLGIGPVSIPAAVVAGVPEVAFDPALQRMAKDIASGADPAMPGDDAKGQPVDETGNNE